MRAQPDRKYPNIAKSRQIGYVIRHGVIVISRLGIRSGILIQGKACITEGSVSFRE